MTSRTSISPNSPRTPNKRPFSSGPPLTYHPFVLIRPLPFLFVLSLLSFSRAENSIPWQSELTVRLRPSSPLVTDSDKALHQLLDGLVPPKKTPATVLIKGQNYILYGDLFHTGDTFALAEVRAARTDVDYEGWSDETIAALALWRNGSWRLRALWKIPVTWRPANWKAGQDLPLPVRPSPEPFKLIALSGDRTPEVVIEGNIGKYYQEKYLFRFSPREKTLHLLEASLDTPKKLGPYLRLYRNSGRRSIWEEWGYYKWKGLDLVKVASWHDETPYNQPDEPFIDAVVFGKNGHPVTYHITDGENPSDHETTRIITRDGHPYAKVTFVWPQPFPQPSSLNSNEIETAWLFHRLSGLPLDTFPTEEKTPPPPFPKIGQIRLSGTKEALHQLSGRF